jgi:hypothetical protein
VTLTNEVELVQNAALGAVLEWKFCVGYSPEDGELRGTPLPLLFLVLPMCFTEQLRELVLSTRAGSGLRKFEEKLRDTGADRVWAISDRAIAYRRLTTRSLAVALSTKLLRLEAPTGTAWGVQSANPKGVVTEIALMLKAAERLGGWCGAHPIEEVASILRVQF